VFIILRPPIPLISGENLYHNMKISTSRLKQIVNEELFYREFHRETQELEETQSVKDERVSRKIAYLVDKEGKPRDQAVAIAHSMEERGELE